MTNATKTLAIIFAGTVVLALASTWGWGDSSSAAFENELLSVDTSAVQAVQIEKSNGPPIRLERTESGWSVIPPDTSATYPASTKAVNELFTALPSLEVSAVATRQTENHPRYGVDSTGTAITMLGSGDEPLGQLIVGRTRIRRPQSRGQGQNPMQRMRRRRGGTPITYVRNPDRPDVYSVERALQSVTGRELNDWRDKRIWTVDQSKIQRIDFTLPGDSSFTMKRTAQDDTASTGGSSTWISAGDTLSNSETSPILRTLATLEADGFATGRSPDAVGPPVYSVRIHLSDGSQQTLELRPDASGEVYLGTTDGFPYVARLKKDTWDRTVLQGRSALLEN